jgi:hypothetical protein
MMAHFSIRRKLRPSRCARLRLARMPANGDSGACGVCTLAGPGQSSPRTVARLPVKAGWKRVLRRGVAAASRSAGRDRGINWCFGYHQKEADACIQKALELDPSVRE